MSVQVCMCAHEATGVHALELLYRGVDKFVRVGGLGCCCVYMQIFSPKIQCTAILLDKMNLKNWGGFSPLAPPLVYTLAIE